MSVLYAWVIVVKRWNRFSVSASFEADAVCSEQMLLVKRTVKKCRMYNSFIEEENTVFWDAVTDEKIHSKEKIEVNNITPSDYLFIHFQFHCFYPLLTIIWDPKSFECRILRSSVKAWPCIYHQMCQHLSSNSHYYSHSLHNISSIIRTQQLIFPTAYKSLYLAWSSSLFYPFNPQHSPQINRNSNQPNYKIQHRNLKLLIQSRRTALIKLFTDCQGPVAQYKVQKQDSNLKYVLIHCYVNFELN